MLQTGKPKAKAVDPKIEIDDDEDDVKPAEEELARIQEEAFHVLYDDSEEDEIQLKTPPHTVRRRSSVHKPSEGQNTVLTPPGPRTRSKRKLKAQSPQKTPKKTKK